MLKKLKLAAVALLLPLIAFAQSYPSPTFQNVTVRGTLTAATPTFTNPLPVASGGTNCSTASGTCLDNITGFSSTGFVTRTGAGTYAFQSLTNGITYGNLAQAGANTLLGNATGSTANVTAVSVTGCNGAAQALQWTNGTGFGCNSGIATSGANANITSLSGLSTPLSVSQGGTGGATLAQYQPLAGAGTGAITTLGTGTSGQVLTSNGPSAYPSFQSVANAGRLLNVQVFTSSGTYTPTTGTNSVIVEVQAAGGGTGGVAATGAGQLSASPGAGAGAYAEVRFTTGFSGATVTIGAAGSAGAAGGNGGNASATSFGALISCPGGNGTNAGTAVTGSTGGLIAGAAPTAAPTISGGTTINSVAGAGTPYSAMINSAAIFTSGANSILGLGGVLQTGATTTAAVSGSGYGSGPSGAVNGASASAAVGKAGQPAIVIVYEFS